MDNSQTNCCPSFNPQSWEKQEITFNNKLFIKTHFTNFFNIPLNFKSAVVRNVSKIAQGALPQEPMILSYEKSFWRSDIYIAVNKNVPGAEMVKLSGTFSTQVVKGPYKNVRQWIKQAADYVREKDKNKNKKKLFYFYAICPRCAKFYGKNHVVLEPV